MSKVRLRGISKSFGRVEAVREVTLEIARGELVAVLGPSGCGKTTLLRLIAGFEAPDTGCVVVGDEMVAGPGRLVPPEKRRIGMVFQDYALFPHLSVEANVAFGLATRARPEREALTRRTLELVGLQHKAESHPGELSGGERQRVALARALAPELVAANASPGALSRCIAAAFAVNEDRARAYRAEAAGLLAAFTPDAIAATIAARVLPALLDPR